MNDFDAIVVGSGISGGWVAKELTERGLKVLMLERGREIVPEKDYTDMLDPWDRKNLDRVPEDELKRDFPIQGDVYAMHDSTKHFWVKDHEHPYEFPEDKRYEWRRGYHLGGRSIMWGRFSWRWSPIDFEANLKDGHGVDWPIRYDDLAPWYDKTEIFAGISGRNEGLIAVPDGKFLPPFEMTEPELAIKKKIEAAFPGRKLIEGRSANLKTATSEHEALGRGMCQVRSRCYHGCSYGAYFSSNSATLPAAMRTGNFTLVTDAIVQEVVYDAKTQRVTGVRVVDANTKEGRTYTGRMVFLNASTIATAMILLNSKTERFPNGLANDSDQVGRNLMDHVGGVRAVGRLPGFLDTYYSGRRPNSTYLPRYANITEMDKPYQRGFAYQVYVSRGGWSGDKPGIGEQFKKSNRTPGDWTVTFDPFGEVLPDPDNRMTFHPTKKDGWGMPIPYIDAAMGANEMALIYAALDDAEAMMKAAGIVEIKRPKREEIKPPAHGSRIHEMGTARMGRDPKTSVLNGWNQAHDVPNLFITDGACMTSSAVQNPSLTYMALSARAANHAADLIKEGRI
jgi:choline dehydrogenase-like flavoprotein